MARTIVIFDLNGTLIDSMPGLIDDVVGVLRDEYGVDESISRPIMAGMASRPMQELAPTIAELTGRGAGEGPRVFQLVNDRFVLRPAVAFPETREVLDRLKRRGYTLVLSATMRPDAIELRLLEADIIDYFPLRLGADPAAGLLKGADHFAIAARELGMTLEAFCRAAVSVGDGVSDMQLAREAGIVAIGRLTAPSAGSGGADNGAGLRDAGADYVIGDLRELEAILTGLG
ncbi:MAG TPA: HAD family hydrolase [Dehalococcoidia bacterium]|nr:HAD family hydrolase [Dehalococcoidia bacterium]